MKENAHTFVRSLLVGTAACQALFMSTAGHAQGPSKPNSEQAKETSDPSDIIVTANRTESTAQKTPVALTVYKGAELREQDVHTVNALQTIDPSVQVTYNTGSPYVAVRGIESTNTTEVGNPSVSVARDGFFVNRTYTLSAAFYDLERVEILKGPQGTLFGRNSTGGLINLISAKPNFDGVSGYAIGTVGDYSLFGGEAALNLPVNNMLALRFSGFGRSRDGYRRVTGIDIRGDDERFLAGRAQLLFRPSSSFDVLLEYNHDHVGGVGDVAATGPVGQPFTGNAKHFVGYQPVDLNINVDHFQWQGTLRDLPFDGTLVYQGGTDLTRYHHVGDTSGFNQSGAFTESQFTSDERVRTTNHELRFSTSDVNPFYFQVGAFFFKEHNQLLAGFLNQSGAFANNYLITFTTDVKSSSKAVFGQASYRLGDTVTLTAGARETWDSISRTGISDLNCEVAGIPPFLYPIIGCTGTPPSQVTVANGHQRQSKFTYRLGVDWQVTPDRMLYAKFDTGYQPGGFSQNPTNPDLAYGPQTVKAFEVGSKNRFFDRRLTFNIDAFYQTLQGYQASRVQCSDGSTGLGCPSFLANVGTVTSYGIEAMASAQVTPTTRLDTNLTWLHARFGSNLPPVTDNANGIADISKHILPNAPSFVWTGRIQQTVPIGASKLIFNLDGKYSSRIYYDYLNVNDTSSASYFIGNFSVQYTPPGERWTLQAYVKNFTDKAVYSRIARNAIILSQQFQFQPPRTFGAQFSYRF